MFYIVPQTYEEKFEMYMKMRKKELIEMLLENQRIVAAYTPIVNKWVNSSEQLAKRRG